jgi:iron complex transport system substrate-binding protein
MKPTRRKLLLLLLLSLACFGFGLGSSIALADGGLQRIVSLSPATTEWVFEFGLGSSLVGRTEACDYPSAAVQAPSVGGFLNPNIGLIMKLKPTIVIVTSDFNMRRVAELERAGLPMFRYDVTSVASMLRSAQELAVRLGVGDSGQKIISASKFIGSQSVLTAKIAAKFGGKLSYLGFVDVRDKYLVSDGSFLGSVFARFGLNNVLEIKEGYPQLGLEFLRKQRPSMVILFDSPRESLGTSEGPLQVPEVEMLAIKNYWPDDYGNMRIMRLPGDLFLRPGPRLLKQGYDHLVARLDALGGK